MKRNKRILAIFTVLVVSVLILAACSNSGDSNQQTNTTNENGVSLTTASDEVKAIYNSRCVNCHATDLAGKMGEKTNLQNTHERLSSDEIAAVISEGRGRMPGFKDKLTTEEIDSLTAWLSKQ